MYIRNLNVAFLCISILFYANYLFAANIDKSLDNWADETSAVKVNVTASTDNLQIISKLSIDYDENYALINNRNIISNDTDSISNLPQLIVSNLNISQSNETDITSGQYYFWGESNDQFLQMINPLLEVETHFDPVLKKIIVNTIFLALISFLVISLFLTNISKLNTNLKKCSLLAFEGFDRWNIIIHYIKLNFIFDLSCILIIAIILTVVLKIPIIYTLLSVILILVLLLLNYLIDCFRLFRYLSNVNIKIYKKSSYVLFNICKSIFLSIVITLILVTANMLRVNIDEYNHINSALNIRNDYGMFRGTNSGNDSEDFFFSDSFHNLENEASLEIIPNIDYLFASSQFDQDNNPSIIVNNDYFDYNNIVDNLGNDININELDDGTCYYFVPHKQIDAFPTQANCKSEKIIEIADGQSFPTYNPHFPNSDYGLITDTVLMLFPDDIIAKQYASYTNIYYPLNNKGGFEDEQYVTSTLKSYGILDNTSQFQTGNQFVDYLFIGIKVIILGLSLVIIVLSLLLIYMLFITINQLFKDKYMYATLLRLEGFNIVKSYHKILKVVYIGTIIELIIVNFISPYKICNISFWICILIVYGIETVIVLMYIRHLETKSQVAILKGEYD